MEWNVSEFPFRFWWGITSHIKLWNMLLLTVSSHFGLWTGCCSIWSDSFVYANLLNALGCFSTTVHWNIHNISITHRWWLILLLLTLAWTWASYSWFFQLSRTLLLTYFSTRWRRSIRSWTGSFLGGTYVCWCFKSILCVSVSLINFWTTRSLWLPMSMHSWTDQTILTLIVIWIGSTSLRTAIEHVQSCTNWSSSERIEFFRSLWIGHVSKRLIVWWEFSSIIWLCICLVWCLHVFNVILIKYLMLFDRYSSCAFWWRWLIFQSSSCLLFTRCACTEQLWLLLTN